MSFEKRRTATVQSIVEDLFAEGRAFLRPGHVNALLRERGLPMGTWEVRAEFARLEREGVIVCEAETGNWLPGAASLKETG
ncbi:MAG: hypothetical protein AAF529_17490 [Pseudomonadota bacterium]